MDEVHFAAELWCASAQDAWRFVAVPSDFTTQIRLSAGPPTAFGSVKVEASIGATRWRTSVFPDAARGCYLLPVKRTVREAENLDDGDLVTVSLRVLDV